MDVFKIISILLINSTFLLLNNQPGYGIQSDIDCLSNLKASLLDPLNALASWNFQNMSEGFICKFTGIECWNEDENKILRIHLSAMELTGEFPRALANCSALTDLDLSNNKLYGTIPADISTIFPYVTQLDLSFNNFTGSIPKSFANLPYLYHLMLNNNGFSGQIPPGLGSLRRRKTFSVANNFLTGPVPNISCAIIQSYEDNTGLCGDPLPSCSAHSKIFDDDFISGFVVGVLMMGISTIVGMFFYIRRLEKKKDRMKRDDKHNDDYKDVEPTKKHGDEDEDEDEDGDVSKGR